RLVHNPEIAQPAKRFLDLGLAVEMPHGLLKNLHRVELVVLVEIVRHPAGEPGLRPQQCRFFRKFFQASDLASRAADRIVDKSIPPEEQRRRKRALIKGPKEFRDLRADLPESETY